MPLYVCVYAFVCVCDCVCVCVCVSECVCDDLELLRYNINSICGGSLMYEVN